MAIKIINNGKVEKVALHSSDITVLDVANKFKNKDLESVITEISDTEHIHIGEVNLEKEGVWIEDNDNLDSSESNTIVDRLKSYFNGMVGDLKALTTNSKDSLVNAINENTSNVNQLSNLNLFVNYDFQIWQRGTEFTPNATAFEYTCDRWRVGSDVADSIQVSKGDKGVKIKATKVSGYINFLQIIEDDTMKSILGKKVTITFKFKEATDKVSQIWGGGINSEKTMTYHANKSFTGVTSDTFTTTMELKEGLTKNEFGIQMKPTAENQEFEILWAKFEVGEKATPFTPASYAEQLDLCQRYFQNYVASGVANETNCISGVSRFPVIMRVNPTISYTPNSSIHQHGLGGIGTVEDITESSCLVDRVDFIVTRQDYFTIGKAYNVGGVKLDAEIY